MVAERIVYLITMSSVARLCLNTNRENALSCLRVGYTFRVAAPVITNPNPQLTVW